MQTWKRIDKYQLNLNHLLGQGSYASVYLGKTIDTGEKVAVKVIQRKQFLDSYNLKNLQLQTQIMKSVSHQNIVKCYDVYQTQNNMYIITQLCDNDLCTYLENQNKKLSQSQAKRLIKQIMKGAKYLHTKGITHRDLKPANILMKNAICKISDFGFARHLGHSTIMKSIVGTPLYMSPQILKGLKYTSKSDLWSIGLIYYELIHGRTPWLANNQLQLITAIYSRKAVYARDISEVSKDFIQKCLQINQADRMSWEEAFQHKILKQFSRDHKQVVFKQHSNLNKQNLLTNHDQIIKEPEITYIKVSNRIQQQLSQKALANLLNKSPLTSRNNNRTLKTPLRSRTVAKFAGSRMDSTLTKNQTGSPFKRKY